MKFKKNVLLIIEEFIEGYINCPGCASIKKFSFIKKEEEVLVFPFSCFEIKRIKKVEEKDKNQTYYIIYLGYLGKYEKLFKGMNPVDLIEEIPEDSFLANEVFKTDIIEEKYKNIFFKKYGGGQDIDNYTDYYDDIEEIEKKINEENNKINANNLKNAL